MSIRLGKRWQDELLIVLLILLFFVMSVAIYANPVNPDSLNVSDSDRRTSFGAQNAVSLGAQAGNVTELYINTSSNALRWQGYYGNISGTITLDNAQNWTLYSWGGDIAPQGEIFAATSQVSNWTQVRCMNLSAAQRGFNCSLGNGNSTQCLNITELQAKYGGQINGGESINTTFIRTADIQLDFGTLTNCPSTNLNVRDVSQTVNYTEVLLWENNTETAIFGSIINASNVGFDNVSWDFQMIVGENGDIAGTTAYFFYVELA